MFGRCRFKAYDWMHIIKHGGLPLVMDSPEYDAGPSMESLMVFLATLVGVRTNLCEYLKIYLIYLKIFLFCSFLILNLSCIRF